MASLELTPDYSAIYLFPPSLEDWIPPTHEARLIRDLVETMPLKDLGFHQRETTEGRPSYSSSLLLSIWLYGMLLKVRSSRQLERACRDYLPMIWLTGRLTPDHNTIARFFNAHQTEFPKLFTAIVQAAAAAGHVGMALHAIDGTKIRSRSSNRTVSLKQRLAESRKEIEESFTRLTAAIAATDAEEDRIIEAYRWWCGTLVRTSGCEGTHRTGTRGVADRDGRAVGGAIEAGEGRAGHEGIGCDHDQRVRTRRTHDEACYGADLAWL
jgi:transposase